MTGFSDADLNTEIWAVVQEMTADGKEPPASWVATAVLKRHPGLEGDETGFYALCAAEHVRGAVRRAMSRLKGRAGTGVDTQLVMPGFARLQKFYLVSRDGEPKIIHLDRLTDFDIDQKVAEYEAMAEGCQEHAKELLRYKASRKVRAAE